MNIDFSDWSQNINIFMSHEKTHPKATLAEEGINTWVNKITCAPIIYLLHSPLFLHNKIMNKAPCVKNRSYTQSQKHKFPLIKANLITASAKYLPSEQQSTTLRPHKVAFPTWQRSPSYLFSVRLIIFDHFHQKMGRIFFSLKQLSGYKFALSACNAFAKTNAVDLKNASLTI